MRRYPFHALFIMALLAPWASGCDSKETPADDAADAPDRIMCLAGSSYTEAMCNLF